MHKGMYSLSSPRMLTSPSQASRPSPSVRMVCARPTYSSGRSRFPCRLLAAQEAPRDKYSSKTKGAESNRLLFITFIVFYKKSLKLRPPPLHFLYPSIFLSTHGFLQNQKDSF